MIERLPTFQEICEALPAKYQSLFQARKSGDIELITRIRREIKILREIARRNPWHKQEVK